MVSYAHVVVETPLMHLDRPFDYVIPPALAAEIQFGTRVRVLFGGRKLSGYVVGFADTAERPERVTEILEVVGAVPLLTQSTLELARMVGQRWVGSVSDVLRTAIPPRQVRAERALLESLPLPPATIAVTEVDAGTWVRYAHSKEFLASAAAEVPGRWAMTIGPGHRLDHIVSDVVSAFASRGRSIIVVIPDNRDVERLRVLLTERIGDEAFVVLNAELPPAQRYRNFLKILRDEVRIVIGSRPAVFAPVSRPGLIIVVDDGDDTLAEPKAPYWHAREVAALRSREQGWSLLAVSTSRSCEVQQWVETGWAIDLECDREFVRRNSPVIRATTDADLARDPVARAARLPHAVFAAIREGLKSGPVLIQVPRRGYQMHLSCARCREAARCERCQGPLSRSSASAPLVCMRCGAGAGTFACPWCSSTEVRSFVIGSARTAEELGRAFPDIRVLTSGRDNILDAVADEPALVIATPGAEPRVTDGWYAACALLDAELSLGRIDLRTHEEAVRRWQHAVSLVHPQSGRVAIVGPDTHPAIQALIRRDPVDFARRELRQRHAASMLPAFSVAEVVCTRGQWQVTTRDCRWADGVRVLGPVPVTAPDGELLERILITSPRAAAASTAVELRALLATKSGQKRKGTLSVRVDPVHLG